MHHQPHITLVNGIETSALGISDRGLAYGDGLFETMRVVDGAIPLLSYNLSRFKLGLERLGFNAISNLEARFKHDVQVVLRQMSGKALIKVLVTRGSGGRGYASPVDANPTLIVQAFDLPSYPREYYEFGVSVRSCQHRLPIHPPLAAIKHLNRLDQVIASQELSQQEQEGLVRDANGFVVEGTKSNLLVIENDVVYTPIMTECGVEGTLRNYLIDHSKHMDIDIVEAKIEAERLQSVNGLALINSVFGLWPVRKLDNKSFPIDPICEKIRTFLNKNLGFEQS